jgi:uncharacterized membrane protein
MEIKKCNKTNYTSYGMIFGAGIGMIFGAAFGFVAYGLPIGVGVGLLLGKIMDNKYSKKF